MARLSLHTSCAYRIVRRGDASCKPVSALLLHIVPTSCCNTVGSLLDRMGRRKALEVMTKMQRHNKKLAAARKRRALAQAQAPVHDLLALVAVPAPAPAPAPAAEAAAVNAVHVPVNVAPVNVAPAPVPVVVPDPIVALLAAVNAQTVQVNNLLQLNQNIVQLNQNIVQLNQNLAQRN